MLTAHNKSNPLHLPNCYSAFVSNCPDDDDTYLDHESVRSLADDLGCVDGSFSDSNQHESAESSWQGLEAGEKDAGYTISPEHQHQALVHAAPTLPVAEKALDDLKLVLKPLWKNGVGHIWVDLPFLLQEHHRCILERSKWKASSMGKQDISRSPHSSRQYFTRTRQ
jgi:hypothetical protein